MRRAGASLVVFIVRYYATDGGRVDVSRSPYLAACSVLPPEAVGIAIIRAGKVWLPSLSRDGCVIPGAWC